MISAVAFFQSAIHPSGHSSSAQKNQNQKQQPQQMPMPRRRRSGISTMIAVTLATALLLGVATAATTVTAGASAKAVPTHTTWAQNEPARFYITKYEYNAHKFLGNHSDYFKILHQDEDTLLVGGKNALYNLSIATLQERPNTRIQWLATDAHRQLCMLKGKHEKECQNYIRVYGKVGEEKFLLCGTNAYKPQCREYNAQRTGQPQARSHEEVEQQQQSDEEEAGGAGSDGTSPDYDNEEEAQGRCPYNPQHSSAYVFAGKNLAIRGVQ